MLPVLFRLAADTPLNTWVTYLVALSLVLYAAWSGYAGAVGPKDPKTGKFTEPSANQKWTRTAIFAGIGTAVALAGLHFALPSSSFLGGQGRGIPLHTYGIMIGVGFLSAVWVASKLAEREWPGAEGLRKRDQVYDLAFWVFAAGIGGAMLLFRLVNWKNTQSPAYYLQSPVRLIDCVTGGMVFYGGLIGAGIAAYLWARANKVNFLRLADVAIPTVSLGQVFGRLGCFGAGCCWGDPAPSSYPFGVHFPGPTTVKTVLGEPGSAGSLVYQSQSTDPKWVVEATGQVYDHMVPGAVRISDWVTQHQHTLPLYPTQLMESLGQFVIFLALIALRPYRRFHGQIFGIWLMAYAVLRSTIEIFRGDFERGTLHGLVRDLGWHGVAEAVPLTAWYNLSTSMFISICMFAFGLTLLLRERQRLGAPRDGVDAPPSMQAA